MPHSEFTTWLVKCEHCGHEFKTKALKPCCSKCHSYDHIKWVKEMKK